MGAEHLTANPRSSLFRCSVHLREDLKKSTKGRESLDTFNMLLSVPPGAVAVADRLMKKLPKDSPLHNVPKEHFCQAYMKAGACLHGDLTGNNVECLHVIYNACRDKVSLLERALAAASVTCARNIQLQDVINKFKESSGGTGNANSYTPFETGVMVPFVTRAHSDAVKGAQSALPPTEGELVAPLTALVDPPGAALCPERCWMVARTPTDCRGTLGNGRSGGGHTNRVVISKLMSHEFGLVCTCGGPATSVLWCSCCAKVFGATRSDWRDYVKPWQRARATCLTRHGHM